MLEEKISIHIHVTQVFFAVSSSFCAVDLYPGFVQNVPQTMQSVILITTFKYILKIIKSGQNST